MSTLFDLDHLFSYHAPDPAKQKLYAEIRVAAKAFAQTILENTPNCADQTVAIRLVREAVMVSNAAIALDGRLFKQT